MRHQFHAATLDDDQTVPDALVVRAKGRLTDMEASIGQYLGLNQEIFHESEYRGTRIRDARFVDDQGVPLRGALYEVVEL